LFTKRKRKRQRPACYDQTKFIQGFHVFSPQGKELNGHVLQQLHDGDLGQHPVLFATEQGSQKMDRCQLESTPGREYPDHATAVNKTSKICGSVLENPPHKSSDTVDNLLDIRLSK
jgi:hypothetical protein